MSYIVHKVCSGVFFQSLVCVFPGLPYGLPDTVLPAAVLQHVLRSPQQHRETNSTVYRPLALLSAAPTLLTPMSQHRRICCLIASALVKNVHCGKEKGEKHWG